ncbi:MAG TPA: branched-chain amino acid ABC transporter permease [Dermatophilaceae bacterium]|nr:branched-chain amino acid ABC transporter permease [Dermatophilaceae bacterium]
MTTTTGVFHTTYRSELALRRTNAERLRLVLIGVVVVVAPFVVNPYWLSVLDRIAIAVIGAVGLNILVGFTGLISLGQGGFLAVGAYTTGVLLGRYGTPPLLAMLVAVVVTAAVGTLAGLPALRLKGLYLAIATLASQVIILWVVRNWEFLTEGEGSIVVPPLTIAGFTFDSDRRWYWLLLSLAVLAVLAGTNLFRTGLGRALVAIRDQDIAAEVIGVPVGPYKLLAFAISSGFVGLAGALTASYRGIITWERFTLDVSILYLAMIIIGGLGSIAGSVYGAIFMIAIPAYIDQVGPRLQSTFPTIVQQLPAIQLGVFGALIVLFLIFEPRGLARLWQRVKDYFRLWPFRY